MSSNLQPYAGGQPLATRDARQLARASSRNQARRVVRGDNVEQETDVAMDKLQNLTLATGSGMTAVANLATAQQTLEQMVPGASGRLALIADRHALDVAETLSDLRARLRRL